MKKIIAAFLTASMLITPVCALADGDISVEDFVKACKNASKNVGAFDDLNATQGENTLFGYGDGNGAHFDAIMAKLLENTEYAESYNTDLARVDALGNGIDYRLNMYTPMYYIDDMYSGYKTADAAKYFRIRTGINQGDTALSTEVNYKRNRK